MIKTDLSYLTEDEISEVSLLASSNPSLEELITGLDSILKNKDYPYNAIIGEVNTVDGRKLEYPIYNRSSFAMIDLLVLPK
jgi:hypothetical protein